MTERENNQIWNQSAFWKGVENAWPGVLVVNKEKMISPQELNTVVILCPLYAKGDLRTAGLIKFPAGIEDSRIANKLGGYFTVLNAMSGYVNYCGGQMNLNVVFANKGILSDGTLVTEDELAIKYHGELYRSVWEQYCQERKIRMTFSDYEEMGIKYPKFSDPSKELPASNDLYCMINLLNDMLKLKDPVVNNRKNRKKVEDVIDVVGFVGAYWLISGYLAFDYKISQLAGNNGIYLMAERMVSLFGISALTESLKGVPRVQIPA